MYNECKHRDRLMHEISDYAYSNNETEKLYEALDNWKKYGKNMKTNNIQIGGSHYTSKTVQPWDAMQAWMTHDEFKGFLRGNAIKYLARCNDKGGIEDLRKARHYLDKLIELEISK